MEVANVMWLVGLVVGWLLGLVGWLVAGLLGLVGWGLVSQ
jgi:hypothetical protein